MGSYRDPHDSFVKLDCLKLADTLRGPFLGYQVGYI